jgi:hypothetical protein
MRSVPIASSAAFGALAVVVTATLFACLALLVGLGISRAPAPVGTHPVLETTKALTPLLLPVAIFGFTVMFASLAGAVAAVLYHLSTMLVVGLQLPRAVLVLFGAACGALGAKASFPFGSPGLQWVGAVSGFVAALSWLFLPAFASVGKRIANKEDYGG